jgi:pseudouridine kinase
VPDVIVIGGANLDVRAKIGAGHVPATSNPGAVSFEAGGVARNIAAHLAALGEKTALITALGMDAAASMLHDDTPGVDLSMSLTCDAPTGTYVAMLDHNGELITAVSAMDIMDRLSWDHVAAHEEVLRQARLIIADCNLRRDVLEQLAKHHGAKLIVEPVSVPKSVKLIAALAHGRIFLATPNLAQAKSLTGCAGPEAAATELLANGLKNVIIHQGAAGAFLHQGKAHGAIPSQHLGELSDVTGAGDAAVAGAAFGLLQGHDLMQAAKLGQAAAALKLSGTPLTRDSLIAMAGE